MLEPGRRSWHLSLRAKLLAGAFAVVAVLSAIFVVSVSGQTFHFDGEEYCAEHQAWPNGSWLGQFHPWHQQHYINVFGREQACPNWASDQRHSAIAGLRELGYTVTPPERVSEPAPTPTPAPAATNTAAQRARDQLLNQLTVESEHAAGYSRADWRHWSDLDDDGCDTRCEVLAAEKRPDGSWYSVFDGKSTTNPSSFDIDHLVPLAEAHESGGWKWDRDTRERFANDLGYEHSLIAVSASSNRSKGKRDPAEWLPPDSGSHCFYADAWLRVKVRWSLSVDATELAALKTALADCAAEPSVPAPTARVVTVPATPTPTPTPTPEVDALAMWDDNGNGRITCAEARAHGIAPVHRGHPAYEFMTDRDGDGIVCE